MTFEPLTEMVVRCDAYRRRCPERISPALATVTRERDEGWTVRTVLPAQHGGETASYRPLDLSDRLIPSTRNGVFVSDEPRSIVLTCRLCSARASIRFHRLVEGAIAAVAECREAIYV